MKLKLSELYSKVLYLSDMCDHLTRQTPNNFPVVRLKLSTSL